MSDVQDLNTLGATTTGSTTTASATAGQIVEKPFDPSPARENIRGTIALWLVWTLVGVIGLVVATGLITMYGCHAANSCTPETSELKAIRVVIELVLTPSSAWSAP